MSRNPDDYTDSRRAAAALERIADTLDDYMEMSLSAQGVALATQALNPDIGAILQPLIDALQAIRERRATDR